MRNGHAAQIADDPISEDDFCGLVKRMREAQREYFACRCPSNLNRAKKLERQVDGFLRERERAKGPQQGELPY